MSNSGNQSGVSNKKKGFFNPNTNAQKKNVLNIQLINKNNVLLSGAYSIFSEKLKQIIRACEGKFITEEKGWMVPRTYLESILKAIQNENLEVPLNKIPAFVDKILQPFNGVVTYRCKTGNVKIEYEASDKLKQLTDLPQEFYSKLYAFQKKGVEFGIKNYGRALIADEMGVGKTIQALALASMYKTEWPFIVIAPSSLRLTWRDEILKWIDEVMPSEVQVITKSGVDIKANIKALVISYDLASKISDTIEDYNFKMAIVDEAHYLKNAEAKRTENLVPIIMRCKRCILLTGTPAFARPKELYNMLHILRPDVFSNFREFGNRYCDPKANRFSGGLDYNGAVNTKELHYILMNSIMIRRLKRDVLTELPPKRRQKVEIKADAQYVKKIQDAVSKAKGGSGQLASMIDNLMGSFFQADEENFEREVTRLEDEKRKEQPEVLQCYLYTGLAKIAGVREYLHDLLQNDIKLLVFAHHTEVLNGIEEEVKKMKIKYIRIDGSVDVNKRYESVKLFQEDESVKIGVLSLTAAGVGLTLTAASTVVFAEMYWTPAVMLQAEDRIHRMGQKNKICVNYHYLYGEGTLDSLLYEKLQSKLAIVSEILEGKMEYLDVEETKDTAEEFETNQEVSSGRRKKGGNSSGAGEKSNSTGMFQITNYFKKKPAQTSESNTKTEPKESEKKNASDMDRLDSLDWDDVDRLLQAEQERNKGNNSNFELDNNSRTIRQPITPFDEAINEYKGDAPDVEDIEKNRLERQKEFRIKITDEKEKENFENSVFYACLDEILDSEKALKEKDTNSNNHDIRTFFHKEHEADKRKPEKKEEEKGKDKEKENEKDIGSSFNFWKTDFKKVEQSKESVKDNSNQKEDFFKSGEKTNRTPVKSIENSANKGSNGSNFKGGFRFSFQPTNDSLKHVKESPSVSESSGKKSDKKRPIDVIDLGLDEKDMVGGLTFNAVKKVKETK